MAGRDPDAIAREIEQTRSELADTIDAIADRISPKRAASRGAQAVKAQVSSAREKMTGDGAAGTPSGDSEEPTATAGTPGQSESSLVTIGPKVAAAGAVLLIVLLWRRRRRRSR